MRTLEARLEPFIGLVAELVTTRLTRYPSREIMAALDAGFEGEPAYTWTDLESALVVDLLRPRPGWPSRDTVDLWEREALRRHPLVRWYAVTGSMAPQTAGRVPARIAPPLGADAVRYGLRQAGLEQVLAIPFRFRPRHLTLFGVARSGADYSDEDVGLATRVQPLLVLVERQVEVLSRSSLDATRAAAECRLTAREVAVLRLAADGLTAYCIARRLGASPRTVQKHLEHLYRKLGVRDRVSAIRVAAQAGILVEWSEGGEACEPSSNDSPRSS